MSTSTPTWDAGDFAELVRKRFGDAKADAVIPPLASINEKFYSCAFHAKTALEKMRPHKAAATDHFAQAAAAFHILFHQTEAEKQALMLSLHESRDHIVAFGQCLHSTSDYLAKVVYLGLDFKGTLSAEIPAEQIGLYSVKKKIAGLPQLSDVGKAIDAYLALPAFKYLSAFVNTEKHHSTVGAEFSLSYKVGAAASAGIQLPEFEYSRKGVVERHPKKWAADFLEADFQAILKGTVDVGTSLSDAIKKI